MNKQVVEYIARKKAEATKQSEATKKQSKFPRTVGFWKNEHGRLLSSPLKKSDIPSYTRLMLLQNRRKKKGDKYPDYIGYFVKGRKEDCLDIDSPFIALSALTEDLPPDTAPQTGRQPEISFSGDFEEA